MFYKTGIHDGNAESWPFSAVFTLLSFPSHHTKEICLIKNLSLKRSQEIRLIL